MKTAIITGASAGIGKATAIQLLNEGYTVYALARRLEKMDDLKALGAHTMKMDISIEDEVLSAINHIIQETESIDFLINNAGFGMYGSIEETTIEDARYQFEVNLFGLARLTQLVIPHMRSKRKGTIINISSVVGKVPVPLGSWYIASKHALEGWSDCLRIELQQFNIKVVIVEPGGIKTEFGDVTTPALEKRSGAGPYKQLTQSMVQMLKDFYEGSKGPGPEVIAHTISKALKAKRPKTRYRKGDYANSMIFMRWILSDRMFDRLILRFLK